MIKRILDIVMEILVLFLWFVVIAITLTWIAAGIVDANAEGASTLYVGLRAPAVLTVAAEVREAEMCLIPAAQPPQPKRTELPEPYVCNGTVCRRAAPIIPAPPQEGK